MDRAPGFQFGYGKREVGAQNGAQLQPGESLKGLVVGAGVVPFGNVVKGLLVYVVGVEIGVQGEVGEIGLWRDDETAVQSLERGTLGEQVENLGGGEVHEGVVDEDAGSGREMKRGGGVASSVGCGEAEV